MQLLLANGVLSEGCSVFVQPGFGNPRLPALSIAYQMGLHKQPTFLSEAGKCGERRPPRIFRR
jgi:hypothetical protein